MGLMRHSETLAIIETLERALGRCVLVCFMKKRSSSLPFDCEVGRRLRVRRRELGLSQSSLGDALDLSYQQVQKYEKGLSRVSLDRLHQIAQILDVPVTFFFNDLGGSRDGQLFELLNSAYSLRMLKAFDRIHDRRLKKSTVELVEAIANSAGRIIA
jgi:transcriptional regulator with XRE-family HTH domain